MCDIPISQIGRRFHYVPRRFIDTVFFPPSIPAWVLRYLKAHPPKWTWTIRAGPRAGTTLTVPTVPIHCSSDAHKAIKWIVSVYHSFKTSLVREETAIDRKGRILPQLIRIYQNNMLMHIAAQMRILERTPPPAKSAKGAPSPPSGPSPPKTTPPPSKEHTTCSAEIAALRAEIADLRAEIADLRKKLSETLDVPAPPSPRTVLAVLKPTRPPSSPSSSISSVRSRTAHPDHQWLQAVLDHKHCPTFLKTIDSTMVPTLVYAIPDDVQQVLQVQHKNHPPVYIGIDSNGDLQVAAKAPGELVTISVAMPPGWNPP